MRLYTMLLQDAVNEYGEIFTFDYPMCDLYKPVFEYKFLLRFRFRNIGLESYPMFKAMLESLLHELMPKYNKLYKSADLVNNPFVTYSGFVDRSDITRVRDQVYDVNNSLATSYNDKERANREFGDVTTAGGVHSGTIQVNTENEKQAAKGNSSKRSHSEFTDSPQNATNERQDASGREEVGSGLWNDGYITTADRAGSQEGSVSASDKDIFGKVASDSSEDNFSNSSSSAASAGQERGTTFGQSYGDGLSEGSSVRSNEGILREYGMRGENVSKLLREWRDTFINVDQLLLDELEQLFMGVY